MPRFLAVFMMNSESVAQFRRLPKSEQDAIDAKGLPLWMDWEKRHSAAIQDRGGMVGKTLRTTKGGVAPAVNDVCGYLIVEAATAEAAARMFVDHPHVTVFPGDSVDIMPFVT